MTAPPLIIRNLTANVLGLKLIEQYEAAGPPKPQNGGNFFSNFTSILGNATAPSATKLAEHTQNFSHQDVSIKIEPFSIAKTDIKATERSPNDTLRLTFEQEGERYRFDSAPSGNASQSLVALHPKPRFHFTGIFIPEDNHLSIHSSANLSSWMQHLNDATPISGLSIPGTHNSPTCHRALPSVRCQAVSPREQLDNGVRFFDVRVQPESPQDPSKDNLLLVHGVFPISLTGNKYFRPLLDEILHFLDDNPSETIILSLKREGPGPATDQQLSTILHTHYTQDSTRWYFSPHIPTLSAVRSKIILLRRFALDPTLQPQGYGIDAENWAYNTPHDIHGNVCVQDFCEVLETATIEAKIKYSCEHLARAAQCVAPLPGITTDERNPVPPGLLYLNFLSAGNFWRVGCWPERIARRLNPAVVRYLCERHGVDEEDGKRFVGDAATGVVVLDWVGEGGDWDVVRCVVGMNARSELREREMR